MTSLTALPPPEIGTPPTDGPALPPASPGSPVRIVQGSLAGLEGVVLQQLDGGRLAVASACLVRGVVLVIRQRWAERIGPNPGPPR